MAQFADVIEQTRRSLATVWGKERGFKSGMLENESKNPERHLLTAVVKRALFDYFGGDKDERQMARDWLFEENSTFDRELIAEAQLPAFSFKWICFQLDINPDQFLNRIQGLHPRGQKRTQEWWYQLSMSN